MPTKQETPPIPTKKTPVFVGKSALVRLINGNDPSTATIWLVDSTNKTLRPFVSEDQFDSLFDNPEQAKKAVTTLPADELGPGGLLADFHVLDHQYGVQDDGSMKNVPFSPAQVQARYGKPINEEGETKAVSALDGLFSQIDPGDQTGGSLPSMGDIPPPEGATPNPALEAGTGGPGSGTVTSGEEDLVMYDGMGGPSLNITSNLGPGSSGADVLALQNWLLSQGLETPTNGVYDDDTMQSVTAWQKRSGIDTKGNDGWFGPISRAYVTSNPSGASTSTGSSASAGTTTTGNLNLYNQSRDTAKEGTADQFIRQEALFGSNASLGGSLTPSFVEKLKNDSNLMGFYIGALAYGGYQMGDIYNDMYRQQEAEKGNTSYTNLAIISPTQTRTAYLSTPEGQKANTTAQTILPTTDKFKSVNPDMFKYTIYQLPESSFNAPSPLLPQPGTPEFKQKASEIKAAYYDLLTAQASATNEMEKSQADYDLNQFNKQIETALGISLSDNSMQAWKQIQNLDQAYSDKGIQGSGIENQAVDEMLRAARLTDTRNRTSTLTQEESKKASTIKSAGTPAEIAALTPEQRQAWGLTPSADVASKFSIEAIKAMDPSLSDEEAKAYRDTVLDENGNYRSGIYSKYYQTKLNNSTNKRDYQNTTLLNTTLDAEKKAARESGFDDPDSPFSKPTPLTPTTPASPSALGSTTTTPKTTVPTTTLPTPTPPAPAPTYKTPAISSYSNLYSYYQGHGKALPSTAEARFADPEFAAAAKSAGYDTNSYKVNMGNAGANQKILSYLK